MEDIKDIERKTFECVKAETKNGRTKRELADGYFGEIQRKLKDINKLALYVADLKKDLKAGINVDKSCVLGMAQEITLKW